MPTFEEFQKRRRGRPPGKSRYRAFVKALSPGEVGIWPLGGAAPESIRASMWWAASEEGVKIQTTVQGDELWVALIHEDDAPAPKAAKKSAARSTPKATRSPRSR